MKPLRWKVLCWLFGHAYEPQHPRYERCVRCDAVLKHGA